MKNLKDLKEEIINKQFQHFYVFYGEDYGLRDHYIKEIAKQFNVSHTTIILHLNKLGIKRRTLHESQYNYRGKDIPKEFNALT